MINTLDDYIDCSISPNSAFYTNHNLRLKVDENRKFKGFAGNTVVFTLKEPVKNQLAVLRNEIYAAASDMLAEPLDPDTFHMTLHDLINGPAGEPGLTDRMEAVVPEVKTLLQDFRLHPPLTMRATWMFNMVNTSIVLGLAPSDADSFARLDKMYEAFEEIHPLGYALCPHVTLAYFRPGTYQPAQVHRLLCALRKVDMELLLDPKDLVLQNFAHMNHYETVN